MSEDIVIRLTGEDAGAKALVDALRKSVDKLNSSGDANAASTTRQGKAAKDAAKGFEQLHGWLKAIAAAEVVRGFIELTKRGIEVAVTLNKMSEQTGVSVEKLSALKFAADQNETSIESLVPAFRGLSKSLQDLNAGSTESVKAFKAIGLSAKDFKGLSLDQSLKLVADRLNDYEDGSGKVAIAQQLLGRSAIELLPLLKALAGDGFEKLQKEASDAGLIMSSETAKSADALDDKMRKLRASIVAAFTPSSENLDKITAAIDALTRKAADGTSELDKWGAALQRALSAIPFFGQVIENQGRINDAIAAEAKRVKAQADLVAHFDEISKPKKDTLPVQDDAAIALARARVQALTASLSQELALEKDNSKILEDANKAAFDRGLKSLSDYYVERRKIIFADSQAEIDILKRQRAAIASLQTTKPEEDVAKASAIAAIDAQIAQRRVQTTAQAIQLNNDEIAARKVLAEKIIAFETSIVTAKGATLDATVRNIDEEIRRDRELLLQRRQLTAEDEKQLQQKRDLLVAQAEFNDISAKGGLVFSDIAIGRAKIEEQVRQGLLSQRDGELAIQRIEQERLPTLKAIGEQMTAFAQATENPDLIAAAARFNASLEGVGTRVDAAQVAMANFKDNAIDALGNTLATFLGSTINQVDSVGDAFRQLALAAVQSIQQIVAQLISLQAVKALRGLFGGGAEATTLVAAAATAGTTLTAAGAATGAAIATSSASSAGALVGAGASLAASGGILLTAAAALQAAAAALAIAGFATPGFATGGFVRGPGTSTSDSIIARLSAGEFVMSAAATKRIGAEKLAQMNAPSFSVRDFSSLRVPGFAAGGLVESGARGSDSVDAHVTIGLDDGLILKTMRSSEGAKIHVEHTSTHKKAIRTVLDR